MTTPTHYFAIGASLAALKNVEITLDYPPHVLDDSVDRRIPLLGPSRERTLDGALSRQGNVEVNMQWDLVTMSGHNTLVPLLWGDWLTASAALYASWLDESGHYSPFSVTLERPVSGEHYKNTNGLYLQNYTIPGYKWTLQTVTKAASYTVTTSDRLIYVDTSGASRTMTLPAASAPQPFTVFSFVKTSASNNMVIDGDGSELIDGATTKTLTALNARADIYSDGSAWYSVS